MGLKVYNKIKELYENGSIEKAKKYITNDNIQKIFSLPLLYWKNKIQNLVNLITFKNKNLNQIPIKIY